MRLVVDTVSVTHECCASPSSSALLPNSLSVLSSSFHCSDPFLTEATRTITEGQGMRYVHLYVCTVPHSLYVCRCLAIQRHTQIVQGDLHTVMVS